jgi:hypothetical protein
MAKETRKTAGHRAPPITVLANDVGGAGASEDSGELEESSGSGAPVRISIPAGTVKRIHVNQHVVRRNAKTGSVDPPISVKLGRRVIPCQSVEIAGPSTVIYSPAKPLACGARIWIETRAELTTD